MDTSIIPMNLNNNARCKIYDFKVTLIDIKLIGKTSFYLSIHLIGVKVTFVENCNNHA